MKRIALAIVLIGTLTGCTNQLATTESEAGVETTADYKQNFTGGIEVPALATYDMMIIDSNQDNMLDENKDEVVDSIADSGFDYSVQVFDTDGDGLVSDELGNEPFTTVINLKNTSGRDIEVSDFQIYLQSSDEEEPITIAYSDTGDMDKSKFILGEEHYENYIRYVDEETYDQFTFPKDDQITIVLTSTVSIARDEIEPAELSFIASDENGISYYVESTTEFAGE